MENTNELVGMLRKMASDTDAMSSNSKTSIEKIATIALIHDQIPKKATLSSKTAGVASGILYGAGLIGASAGAGYLGHKKGKEKGRRQGSLEAYKKYAPYVNRSVRRADIANYVANKMLRRDMTKKSGVASKVMAGVAAVGLPAASYAYGKSKGKDTGRRAGWKRVGEAARRRHAIAKSKYRRAMSYISQSRQKAALTRGQRND